MMIRTVVLVLSLVYGILGSSCPANSPLSFYAERLQNATEEITADVQAIVLESGANQEGPANVTTLYTALTASLNATPSEDGLDEFSDAFDVITDSYFKACYGPEEEKPSQSDAQSILSDFISLLENRSDITRMRQLFGELLCLQNFNHTSTSSNISKRQTTDLSFCARAPDVKQLYRCLDLNQELGCIFNVNSPQECRSPSFRKRNCLAFVVDTTGSMGEEIGHVKTVIQNFIQSEENSRTLCYVLVPFNDYGYDIEANFTRNLEYSRIYDASYLSRDSGSPSFSMTDTSITVRGVNDLLTDVNSLVAHGGGDCPEYGMIGILEAINLIDGIDNQDVQYQGKHNIIVLTDASAKDDSLYEDVIDAADDKDKPDVTVHFFYSGSGCGDGFGHYEDVKNATGGYSVNQINAANFQIFTNFISGSSHSGSKRKRRNTDLCKNFQISHLVSRFSCLIETSSSPVTITRPDNTTETVSVSSFTVYESTDPQPGNWMVCVSSGAVEISVTSPVSLELDIDYLEERENGELLPKSQLPFQCDTHIFTLASPQLSNISLAHPLYLEIIDNLNNVLQYAEVSECESGGFLSGSITLPSGSAQYQLRGHDIGGIPFTHVVPNSFVTFDTPSIQAQLKGKSPIVLNPGGTSIARIAISNIKSGPKSLQASVSVVIQSEVSVEIDSTSITIDPMSQEREMQISFIVSETLAVDQILTWSVVIRDACSSESMMLNFTAIVKPSIPFNVTSTSRSIILEWSPPVDPTLGNITHYVLTLDYTNGTIATVNVSGDINEYQVNELSPYQQVYASIVAHSDNGETAEITPISVFTDQAEPGPVSRLAVESMSGTSIYISWSLPQEQNGIIVFYEVAVKGVYNETHNSSVYGINVHNLNPYTRYTAVVSAATSAGKGQPTMLEFYSLEGVPNRSPSLTNHTILTSESVMLKWNPPPVQYRRGFIQNYMVKVQYMQKLDIYNTSETVLYVSGLPQYSDINVSASISTSVGQGPFSRPYLIHILTGVASAPQNFTATATSISSVLLEWANPESPNGKILHYQIYFSNDNDTYQALNVTIYENSYHFQDLDSGEYYFIVNAINYAGMGDNSSRIYISLPFITTPTAKPSANLAAIVVPSVLVFCLVVLILVVIAVIYFKRIKGKNTNGDSEEIKMKEKGFGEKLNVMSNIYDEKD